MSPLRLPAAAPTCAVILSTYNAPQLLERSLWGYEHQTTANFEIWLADDGSGPETWEVIACFQQRGQLQLHHVWHPDDGFRKTEILNKTLALTTADYVIFSDGDCIPEPGFVAGHLAAARPRCFIAGTVFRMSEGPSQAVTEQAVATGKVFSASWLRQHGQPWNYKLIRWTAGQTVGSVLNQLTPTNLYWCGGNASGWRKDLLAVNGFDERMKYGGEDKELGERLINAGIRPICQRYTLRCLHLEHGRSYVDSAARQVNQQIRQVVRRERRTWTDYGLQRDQCAAERRAA
jgi:glycosyltransferase involved in cell wall biosynthesis